uniref:AT-hook motif nuclear-localized protein 10-like n=1 Tax=Erigeron canadensis TaxID=72917 RepID=UPI001CB8E3D8|nr:AT-hook motif nuclear-localized protein 10-like [Erigeron canadensis]
MQMNGSESGRTYEPAITQAQPQPQPPVSNAQIPYAPGVTGGYGVATDVMSSTGGGGSGATAGGGGGFHRGININEHGGHGLVGHRDELMVKKRGRPRKYAPDGTLSPSTAARAAKSSPVSLAPAAALNGAFEQRSPQSAPPVISAAPVSSVPMEDGLDSVKKARGRPPGSTNRKQKRESFVPVGVGFTPQAVFGFTPQAGSGFTPHIIMVQPGEDVLNKIMSFSQNGPRAVCIMSGIGVITNVTLRQAATSGGTATYEGRFDILALSGSFVQSELYGQRTRTGGLSITLSGPDGRVFGGVVAGLLIAASPVQVIVGSFLPENSKESMQANHVEPLSVTPKVTPASHVAGPSSSQSHGTLSESSGGPGSPLNRGNESSPRGMANMPWK